MNEQTILHQAYQEIVTGQRSGQAGRALDWLMEMEACFDEQEAWYLPCLTEDGQEATIARRRADVPYQVIDSATGQVLLEAETREDLAVQLADSHFTLV